MGFSCVSSACCLFNVDCWYISKLDLKVAESGSNLLQAFKMIGCAVSKAKLAGSYSLAIRQCREAKLAELYSVVKAAKMVPEDTQQQIESILLDIGESD